MSSRLLFQFVNIPVLHYHTVVPLRELHDVRSSQALHTGIALDAPVYHEGELVVVARHLAAVVHGTVEAGLYLTPADAFPLPGEVVPDAEDLP